MEGLNSLLKLLINIGSSIYAYCTDFTINLANLTGTSYYEVNFFFFCVLFPMLMIGLPFIALVLKYRLWKLKRKLS
ncbi:hypothetical protein [Aequorivita marina]|uniref:hypothetical protein n=1 Tax=Aequorivita marina TaxID=3073654 RepID=UPI002876CE67|nr:hypothetical protein [Aequorivita sp. S2608]MDS1296848.1 hypothetical protein [Aequorivita sp. S2608]